MFLNYLYPEMADKWIVRCEGTFYRNYNKDILSLDDETGEVGLSRDGFLKFIPEGLYNQNTELLDGDMSEKYRELAERMRLLKELFLPFDTIFFKRKLEIEKITNEMLEDKLQHLLKEYFNFDLSAEQNPLVRQMAVLLPFVSKKRGDFNFLRSVLGTLLNCEAIMTIGKYSETDTSREWLPKVRYELIVPGLDVDDYRKLSEQIAPLREFVSEWFIPAEVVCEIVIKEHQLPQQTNTRLTLNYNTELNQ